MLTQLKCDRALKNIAAGDKNALGDIYELLGREMYAVAYQIIEDSQLAEDAVQDALLSIMRNAKAKRAEGNAKSYCMTILRNSAKTIVRKRNHESLGIDPEMCPVSFSSDDSLLLDQALKRIGTEDRELVILRAVSGISYKELEGMMEVPAATLRKRYERAIKALRVYIKEGGH